MFQFIVRRILIALVTIFAISIMSFVIIQLPPGDFLTSYVASLASQGDSVSEQVVQAMRENYGL
ncbi:MAG: ABC transporter permease, partial [Anaerolineae bacterium]|nr:ABC transporter permease [Anaerolineae bacterium]